MTSEASRMSGDSWHAVSKTYKALVVIGGMAIGLLSGAFGAYATANGFVDSKIEKHNTQPKTENPSLGPHPEFALAINAIRNDSAAQRNAVSAVLRNQAMETCWKARIQAPDFEPDAKRRKEAADFAEEKCTDAIEAQRKALIETAARNGGRPDLVDSWLDLRAAFKAGVDAVPPWRGIRGAR